MSKNTGKNNGFPFLDILGYLNNMILILRRTRKKIRVPDGI